MKRGYRTKRNWQDNNVHHFLQEDNGQPAAVMTCACLSSPSRCIGWWTLVAIARGSWLPVMTQMTRMETNPSWPATFTEPGSRGRWDKHLTPSCCCCCCCWLISYWWKECLSCLEYDKVTITSISLTIHLHYTYLGMTSGWCFSVQFLNGRAQ